MSSAPDQPPPGAESNDPLEVLHHLFARIEYQREVAEAARHKLAALRTTQSRLGDAGRALRALPQPPRRHAFVSLHTALSTEDVDASAAIAAADGPAADHVDLADPRNIEPGLKWVDAPVTGLVAARLPHNVAFNVLDARAARLARDIDAAIAEYNDAVARLDLLEVSLRDSTGVQLLPLTVASSGYKVWARDLYTQPKAALI
ncbi:uncharacterized protein AMSG_02351 [Thecamonas trahens ATCC 50062]|uniref:Uncharacterized protein n=1 Tax=Thecamonas trahens ATCC 50062 TaxID=461836 RepID=A0A0L0DWC0_THETB|nr:hypothetical protein AMSG_02351 [Thecamonas trahens ATCC 50062]KNC56381.1 hypothetical protein AMSG_02351 [Thecamonas trahens ATCC 50062]|eukprot:XP_013760896.1 hypothetical protein AMSG_02351 [Thecamonas trahens ATCC 50062]